MHAKQRSEDEGRDWGDAEIKGCQNVTATPSPSQLQKEPSLITDGQAPGCETVSVVWVLNRSGVSNSLRPPGLQPARLLSPGISQARILGWVVIPYCEGSSQPTE